MAKRYLVPFLVFTASLLLHALLGTGIYFLPFQSSQPTRKETAAIEVQLHEPVPANSSTPSARSASPAKNRRQISDVLSGGFRNQLLHSIGRPPKGEIGITNGARKSAFSADAQLGPEQSQEHGWSQAVQFGNAMDIQQTFATLPFFMALHQKVDSSLIYPEDFSRQRLTGHVRIEAELARDGRLLRFTGLKAQDQVLQTYCLALLMQALQQSLPSSAWADKSQVVAFEFDFHTHISGEARREFPMVVQKNRLAFGRDNQIEPWLNEQINEVFTHYIPPIIPIPGGVYIDFVLAYQYVRNLIEGVPTERELRQERIDSLHLTLKKFVRQPPIRSPGPTPES